MVAPPLQPFITIAGLRKTYTMGRVSVHALAGISLDILPNSLLVIMGPSGSGKSTLLHLIGGLDRPTAGQIHVGDDAIEIAGRECPGSVPPAHDWFIFQSFNLVSSMTALENVSFPHALRTHPRRKRRDHRCSLLEQVGLEKRAKHHKPTELSGGQQQRVAIARALVNNPQLILADEPTGNLDTASGAAIMKMLSDLHQAGRTVIVVTHDVRMTQYATHVVHLLDGRIVNGEV